MKTTKFMTAVMAIFAIAFLSTFESCTKDDDTNSSSGTVSKSGLISAEGWIMNSFVTVISAPYDTTFNQYDLMDACEKDDILMFKSDKSISSDEGALKCDPNDPQTSDEGTWELASNDTKLIITDDGEQMEFTITTLTSTDLVLENTEYDSAISAEITIKIGFKH